MAYPRAATFIVVLCAALTARGQLSDFAGETRRDIACRDALATSKGHHFPLNDHTLCVPQKNGNRNWGALVYYNKHGKPPASADALLAEMGDRHLYNTHSYPSETTTRRDKYVIARNPYARFLSEYLEHHSAGCVGGAGRGCVGSMDPTKHPEALVTPTRESFGAWAEQT